MPKRINVDDVDEIYLQGNEYTAKMDVSSVEGNIRAPPNVEYFYEEPE